MAFYSLCQDPIYPGPLQKAVAHRVFGFTLKNLSGHFLPHTTGKNPGRKVYAELPGMDVLISDSNTKD
jgi:hypothetical protein